MTSRGPLTLAALASAAVPGLDPSSVEGVVDTGPARSFDVAFVQDHEHRRWVIRCPRTPAASAQLEQSAALLALLTRRMTMQVPAVKGWVALPEGGRAAVHQYLTGRMVDLGSIAPGSKLAAGIGRTLAQLHNLDRRVYEEAGVPVYEAETYRTRRLAELDRAAATGRVPTGLLTRWEHTLENLSLWRFTTTPTHGAVSSSTVLATPDDGDEPDVKALLGWESAQVADPADDLAVLVAELHPETLDTVMEAYAHARADRTDRHLQERARLVHQMQQVRSMMAAVAAGDDDGAEELARGLRRLDDQLSREEEAAAAAAAPVARTAPADDAREDQGAESADDTGTKDAVATEVETAGEQADGDDAETDEAVEVEDTGGPTPVAAAEPEDTDEDESGSDEQADAADESGDDSGVPAEEPTDATSDEDASGDDEAGNDEADADGDDSSDEPANDEPKSTARDHETAEIFPLAGDDGDDVVPPSPRR